MRKDGQFKGARHGAAYLCAEQMTALIQKRCLQRSLNPRYRAKSYRGGPCPQGNARKQHGRSACAESGGGENLPISSCLALFKVRPTEEGSVTPCKVNRHSQAPGSPTEVPGSDSRPRPPPSGDTAEPVSLSSRADSQQRSLAGLQNLSKSPARHLLALRPSARALTSRCLGLFICKRGNSESKADNSIM